MDQVTAGIHGQVENAGKDPLFARLHFSGTFFRFVRKDPKYAGAGPRLLSRRDELCRECCSTRDCYDTEGRSAVKHAKLPEWPGHLAKYCVHPPLLCVSAHR